MKRFFKFSTLFAAVFALVLTSCGGDVTVKFNSNGGSEVAPVTVKSGEKIAEPTKPTKSGFDLVGWYTTPAFVKKWDFASDVVKEDMTLYAKWESNIPAVDVKLSSSSKYYYPGYFEGIDTHNFWLIFYSDNYVYRLDLYSSTCEALSDGYFGPEAGTYDFDPAVEVDDRLPGTFGYDYSYIQPRSTGKRVDIKSGTVTVSKDGESYTVDAVVEDATGEMHHIKYVGKLAFEGEPIYSFEYESQVASTQNFVGIGEYDEGEGDPYGTYYMVVLYDEEETFEAWFYLFSDDGTFNGTYTFRKWETINDIPGSAMVSSGVDQYGNIDFSYVMTSDLDIWFLQSGTVTVTDGSNITVDATSYYGSTINITATGVTKYNPDAAPAKNPFKKGKKAVIKKQPKTKSFSFEK